jgi:alpha-beta hydrolase superfamily lysophospholipase
LLAPGTEKQSESKSMHFQWTAPDGAAFPCERWLPTGTPQGNVICIHGLSGAATDFQPLGETLSRAGLACFALGLRGQGNDPDARRRGASLDLAALSSDIAAFTGTVCTNGSGTPLWVCGESMGALILAWTLAYGRLSQPVRGAIFSAPVVALKKSVPRAVRGLVRTFATALPRLRFYPSWFVSGTLEPLEVTRDKEHADRIHSAPHYIRAFAFRFLHQLGELIESSDALAVKIVAPSLVLSAGQDVFVEPGQVRKWFERLGSEDKTFKTYPEAFHLLWNDLDRDAVLADVAQWLDARCPARLNT